VWCGTMMLCHPYLFGCAQAPGEPRDSAWKACAEGPSLWTAFYMQDPAMNATGATDEELKLLIGGEASTWGDCISAESFDVMTWPAASSVAERLWSPSSYRNTTEAFPRLAAFRCHMVRRGVGAASLHPGSCWSTREID
jgi:N-acetyl-beta-hexosaminidase